MCECVLLCFFVLNSCTNGLLHKKPKVVAIFYSRHYDYNVEPYLLRQGTMACVTSILYHFLPKAVKHQIQNSCFSPLKSQRSQNVNVTLVKGCFSVAFISEAQLACFAVFPN